MVGITLSAEQIHQAPPEVRRWIEQQIYAALGLSAAPPAVEAPERHLIGCDLEHARAILALIGGSLPVAGVFFELAREPIAVSPHGLNVLRLDEMQRHCRLQSVDQVVHCLEAIDKALRQVCGAPDVALTAQDGSGHCLIPSVTAQSIMALWQVVVGAQQRIGPVAASGVDGSPIQSPYQISVPATSVNAAQDGVAA